MAYRKFIFVIVILLLSFFTCPLNVLSTETRGIKPTSSDLQDSVYLGNYCALIIGIDNYKEWNPLKTAVKDAEALKQVLIQRYGFKKDKVVLRTDNEATRLRLILDLRKLASNLGSQDNLLIYYAGHGQLDDLTGDGYWIPVEGKLKNPVTWISHSTIKNILSSERVKGKNIVVVADSCYSGTLLRGGPSLLSLAEEGYDNKLLKLAAHRSRQVITSGGLEPVADGGRDGHSLFAYYFLKALKENNRQIIDLENLFHSNVWKPVTEIGGQRPNVGRLKTPMDEDGQFVLVASNATRQPISANTEFEAENKRLAEEEARIKSKRQELEQLKALMERKKKLEAENQRLEEEKLKLTSIPKAVTAPRVSLRKKPLMISNETEINAMLIEYGFFDISKNIRGSFENHFVNNNDGTVTDKATGLMWQKSGSSSSLENKEIKRYIKRLNKEQFAGYSDWRVPTLEELASLLDRSRTGGIYLNPVFAKEQTTCWTADRRQGVTTLYAGAWIVNFKQGQILNAEYLKGPKTSMTEALATYKKNEINYVKAVRNLEEEKLKLASIPKTAAFTRIALREKPLEIDNQAKINNMLFEYDFFERYKNPRGTFQNVFIDNKDGSITDRATGLMWQKGGSSKSLDNWNIEEYIKRLNTQKLAGYSDWRMPTIEELASLLTRRRKSGVHIDPVFDNKQIRCWSVDQSVPPHPYYSVAWIISFELGEVTQAIWLNQSKAQFGSGSMRKNAMNYIKAVRSVK